MTAKQARKKSMYTRRSVQAFWSGVLALLGWSRRSSAPLRRRSARLAARQAPVAPPRQPLTLSAAERAAVECAWRVNAPGSEVLAEGKLNLQITRRDARTLAGNGWLNDEVVNFYLQLLTESSPSRPSLHLFSSLFYARLACTAAGYDYPGVRRWTKKVDIFSRHLLLVPVNHHNSHWYASHALLRPWARTSHCSLRFCAGAWLPFGLWRDASSTMTQCLGGGQTTRIACAPCCFNTSRTSPGRVQDESRTRATPSWARG